MDQISDFFASKAHNSLLSFWAKLGYSQIEIDHIRVSLLKIQIEIGEHFINDELSQIPTPAHAYCDLAHASCRDAAGISNPGGLAVMWWA